MLFPGTRPPRPEPPPATPAGCKAPNPAERGATFPERQHGAYRLRACPRPDAPPLVAARFWKPGADGRDPAQPLMVVRPPGDFSAPGANRHARQGTADDLRLGGLPEIRTRTMAFHRPPRGRFVPFAPAPQGRRTGRAPRKGPNLHPCNLPAGSNPARPALCSSPGGTGLNRQCRPTLRIALGVASTSATVSPGAAGPPVSGMDRSGPCAPAGVAGRKLHPTRGSGRTDFCAVISAGFGL